MQDFVSEVEVPVTGHDGERIALLVISSLPRPASRRRGDRFVWGEDGLPALVEASEYRYSFVASGNDPVAVDVPEVFHPDTRAGRSGRLRTGEYVGLLTVQVDIGSRRGTFTIDVHSRKLGYETDYQLMLRDIAESLVEAVLQRFSPVLQRFEVDPVHDSMSLYQRFCFLRSIFQNAEFQSAIQQVVADPYVKWVERLEARTPAAGVRFRPSVARAIRAHGQRVPWPGGPGEQPSLPARLEIPYAEETRDNVPNRFVRHVLTRWQAEVAAVAAALEAERPSAPVRRGLAAVREAQVYLEELLGAELFRSVGQLQYFPSENPVLASREGYREVMHAYLISQLAGKLSWSGGDDVYGAGKKDVATLYEYWVFLQLCRVVSELCDAPFSLADLVEATPDGLALTVKKGRHCILSGKVDHPSRRMRVELWFNRTFSPRGTAAQAWTRTLRPDISILIQPEQEGVAPSQPIWLHFDAKYRLDRIEEVFDDTSALSTAPSRPVSSDLAKMHIYRDAIRRSAGAFVIYPGSTQQVVREYDEILPGLGAFALSPRYDGQQTGVAAISRFLNDVISHAASHVTQHERARYWEDRVYRTEPAPSEEVPATPFLAQPPADTLVLLGYVRGTAHLEWIRSQRRYNLRGDDRTGSVQIGSQELSSEYVLLYGRALRRPELWRVSGYPEVRTRNQLASTGYPRPGGSLYLCLQLEAVPSQPQFSLERIREITLAPPRGAPRSVRWDRIIAGL
jgi:predicted component of viral defense system (DUF524 family)